MFLRHVAFGDRDEARQTRFPLERVSWVRLLHVLNIVRLHERNKLLH